MKTDNELIAEFMGWKKGNDGYMVPNLYPFTGYSTGETECTDTEMEFHRRWDWLIHVVWKIEDVLAENRQYTESMWHYWNHQFGGDINTDIAVTYAVVVEFIKWHNTQTK